MSATVKIYWNDGQFAGKYEADRVPRRGELVRIPGVAVATVTEVRGGGTYYPEVYVSVGAEPTPLELRKVQA